MPVREENTEAGMAVLDEICEPPPQMEIEKLSKAEAAQEDEAENTQFSEVEFGSQPEELSDEEQLSKIEMSEDMDSFDQTAPPQGDNCETLSEETMGLLQYKKWWFLRPVDINVGGEMLYGTPIFIKNGTIRLANESDSFFIPLSKVDYIRTCDGLDND